MDKEQKLVPYMIDNARAGSAMIVLVLNHTRRAVVCSGDMKNGNLNFAE